VENHEEDDDGSSTLLGPEGSVAQATPSAAG